MKGPYIVIIILSGVILVGIGYFIGQNDSDANSNKSTANCRPVKIIDVDKLLHLNGFVNGDVTWIWFDGNGNLNEGVFKSNSLTKLND